MTTISATAARANFYDLIDEVFASGKSVGITKKGETRAILVSQEEWDAMMVTLETLSDKELMDQIRKGDEDIKAGRYATLEEVEKELSLDDNEKDVSSKSSKSSKKKSQETR